MTDASNDTDETGYRREQPMADGMVARFLQGAGSKLPLVGQTERSALDLVPVTKAYRGKFAVEHDDGGVIGAIRISPASKAMVDDLEAEVQHFAAALTSTRASRGMLIDLPKTVNFASRKQLHADHAEEQRDNAEALVESALENEARIGTGELAGAAADAVRDSAESDLEDARVDALQADLSEERAGLSHFYQETSTARDYLIVIKVTQEDAVNAVADVDVDSGVSNIPILGTFAEERRKDSLAKKSALTDVMVTLLNKRLKKLAERMRYIEGVSATPVTSVELSRLIADSLRAEDMTAFEDFSSLVRQSPVPGRNSDDPYQQDTLRFEDESGRDLVPPTDNSDAIRRYKQLLSPREFDDTRREFIEVGEGREKRRSATIAVTEWPAVPDHEFLAPLYQYHRPGVELRIATHFERQSEEETKKKGKNQENSIGTMFDSFLGDSAEEFLDEKFAEARDFVDDFERSDYAAFDVAIYVTVSVPASQDEAAQDSDISDENRLPSLEDAVDDVKIMLKEDCGFSREVLNHDHERGWKTTTPTLTNELGTNVTVRADGIARQMPYAYQALDHPNGVRFGVHEFTREPIHLDIFASENGYDGGIYAMKGSGKTTTLQELADANKRLREAQGEEFNLVLCTPLEDFEGLTEAYGGNHIVVGGETGVNPVATRPEKPDVLKKIGEETPWKAMLERLDAFLDTYYDQMGLNDYGKKQSKWKRAAKEANYEAGIHPSNPSSYGKESPTLDDVIGIIRDGVLNPEKYVDEDLSDDEDTKKKWADTCRDIINEDIEGFSKDGQYAHFTKPTEIDFETNDVIYLDLQRYENDERAGGLMMQMLLSDLYEQAKQADGKTMFAIDEFHYMLRNGRSTQFWKQISRHTRHWDLAVWVSTQEFGDLFVEHDDGSVGLSSSAADVFRNQSHQIYQYTKEMNEKWGGALELSQKSQHFIRNADAGDKDQGHAQALLVVDEEEYPLRIEMSDQLNPRAFAVYQYDPTKVTHNDDFWTYLKQYRTTEDGREVDPCDWTWTEVETASTDGRVTVGGDVDPALVADGSGVDE